MMDILTRLRAGMPSALESTGPRVEAVEDIVDRQVRKGLIASLPAATRKLIADNAAEGLGLCRQNAPLTTVHRMALEAIVLTEGRPALTTKNGLIDLSVEEAQGWLGLRGYEGALQTVAQAVGRIDLAGVHVGTGFLVAPGLVLTNRHVAEAIGKAYVRDGTDVWLLKAGGLVIDFCREDGVSATRRHRIVGVHSAGRDPIRMQVRPEYLDAALLEIETISLEGNDAPAPLTLMPPDFAEADAGGEILSIGYPGAPQYEPAGVEPSEEEQKVLTALKRIFGLTYGVKRVSPGLILSRPGRVPDGGKAWTFTHDATTLAGASGSCVVKFYSGKVRVVGLHFGGAWLKHNFSHALPKLQAGFLAESGVLWEA